jgi:glutaconate CoA-transferase, subunit A
MELLPLAAAIERHVRDGHSLALEGFTHLIPFAAGHEIIRQRRRNLHLIRMTPDLIYDQMIGMGCADRLTFSWGGNPGVGSLHRLRDAVEAGWPQPLALIERTHAEMAVAYQAGASGLPCGLMRHYADTDLAHVPDDREPGARVKTLECPFTGASLAAVPAINPDVTILHAHQVDSAGNVLIRGIIGAAKEAALAARCLLVTVEEQVERFDTDMNAVILPGWLIAAVSVVPGGAYPSYAQAYYPRDNSFYIAWDDIARDRQTFSSWMEKYVLALDKHADFLHALGVAA